MRGKLSMSFFLYNYDTEPFCVVHYKLALAIYFYKD